MSTLLKHILKLISMRGTLIFLVLLASGCSDPEQQAKLDEIAQGIKRMLSDASESFDKFAPTAKDMGQMTGEEISKLYTWEYLVREFNTDLSAEAINNILSDLGRDRWECFASINSGSKTKVLCKRRPETYLKYLSHVVPGLPQ